MIESLAKTAEPLLNMPYVRRIRRNHGLEHATVHILQETVRQLSVAGRSDAGGYWLMGDLDTAQVEVAAREALRRMRAGEHELAIHPNCGTSLLTTGTLVGLAALAGSVGVRRGPLDYISRLPSVVLLAIIAIIASRPLGLKLQEHFTTLGDVGNLEITDIVRSDSKGLMGGEVTLHRISTTSS